MQKMNSESGFNEITQARFSPVSSEIKEMMDCDPEKRDGFFKRLFGGGDKDEPKEQEKEEKKKKKGFFKRLFGGKDKN